MSGYNLRALLEDAKFCSSLSGYNNSGSNQNMGKPAVLPNLLESHPQSMGPTKPYETGKFEEPVYNRATASLRNDVWGGADDFDLEYMDLDEFLNETGLVDTNFNSLAANNSPPSSNSIPSNSPPIVLPNISPTHQTMQQQQQQQPTSPHNSIEELLLRGSCAVNSPVPSISPVASPTSDRPTHDASIGQHSPVAESVSINSKAASPIAPVSDTVPANSTDIVKKRKYSEDGEGLTETSVVVVPGREGFDPSNVKFTPEDLQPQPIIKKSKKQFVAEDSKDEKYWKRRNKNNVAAKRSREARRAKENQIIMRAGFLETENERLNEENKQLTEENERLKELVKKLQRS